MGNRVYVDLTSCEGWGQVHHKGQGCSMEKERDSLQDGKKEGVHLERGKLLAWGRKHEVLPL